MLMDHGKAPDMEAAYKLAALMDPEICKANEAADAEKAAKQAAKEADAAKKRSRVNVGKPGDKVAPKRTWEDEPAAIWDEIQAAG